MPKQRMHATAPEAVAIGVVVLLLATNVYRAATQSITMLAEDAGLIEKRKLRTLLRDPETGTALAEKP